jgi:transposase
MSDKVAGIDVHKKVLMVVVMDGVAPEEKPERRRFSTMPHELRHLSTWLQERGVTEVVMESTAQYWRSVWLELEPHMRLHLAQTFSNRAPRGRKHDFKDAERLARRFIAKELILSFVPEGEQRMWRNLARMKLQLIRDRVRLHSQIECLLEEMRIKLSVVVTDLFGVSGLRILHALAQDETDPKNLASLRDVRLQCSEEQLIEALTGSSHPMHRQMLALQLDRLRQMNEQIATLNTLIAEVMKPHQETVIRLAEVPGFGIDSAQQVIAEVGVTASTFSSAAEFTSWVGTCPGKQESAEENRSSRCAKGNKYMRRILNQVAHAAARSKGTHFQAVFRRLLPRLGYQSAIWAIAHRLCRLLWKILHEGARYIEQGTSSEPKLLIHRGARQFQSRPNRSEARKVA